MTPGQIFRGELKELRNAVSGYMALKGFCMQHEVDTAPLHAKLSDQIKVFARRAEEFGDNQTLNSEWNSFVRFAKIAGLTQPNHSTRFVTQVCFSLNNTTPIWYKYVRKN